MTLCSNKNALRVLVVPILVPTLVTDSSSRRKIHLIFLLASNRERKISTCVYLPLSISPSPSRGPGLQHTRWRVLNLPSVTLSAILLAITIILAITLGTLPSEAVSSFKERVGRLLTPPVDPGILTLTIKISSQIDICVGFSRLCWFIEDKFIIQTNYNKQTFHCCVCSRSI